MSSLATELQETVRLWDRRGLPRPQVTLVSGSGLGFDLGAPAHGPFPLADFLPFPCEGIEGHPLKVEVLTPRRDRSVLYFRGRLHAYQEYTASQVVFQVRLGALLGSRVLILSNASGGLVDGCAPGDLLLVRDQINLTGLNPLRGNLPAEWGPRFPDMVEAYDRKLRQLAHQVAAELGIELPEGVYAGLLGPSYETPAEVRMLKGLGADLVGMSTVLEVIAARHLGVRCLGLSLIANPAAGIGPDSLHHPDVLAVARSAAAKTQRLLHALLTHPDLVAAGPTDSYQGS